MEAKDLLVGVLTKTLNKTDEEISELLYQKAEDSDELVLNDDALTLVLDQDADRVSNIKKSVKPDEKALKDQYLKGIKDGKAELEAELKVVANIESSAIGSDLVKEVVNAVSECNLPSDDQIKTHPLYLELEKTRVPKEDYEKVQTEFEEFKSNQDRIQALGKVKSDVLTVFKGLKPVISENAVVAQTRQNDFLAKFDGYDYEISDEGNHLVKKKDGSRLEDKHGNPIKFPDFVRSVAATSYEFNVADDVGNAGNRNTGNGQGGHVDVPKDEKDYLAKMAAATTGEERIKIHTAWKESQNK